jgi:hypothetical protein
VRERNVVAGVASHDEVEGVAGCLEAGLCGGKPGLIYINMTELRLLLNIFRGEQVDGLLVIAIHHYLMLWIKSHRSKYPLLPICCLCCIGQS